MGFTKVCGSEFTGICSIIVPKMSPKEHGLTHFDLTQCYTEFRDGHIWAEFPICQLLMQHYIPHIWQLKFTVVLLYITETFIIYFTFLNKMRYVKADTNIVFKCSFFKNVSKLLYGINHYNLKWRSDWNDQGPSSKLSCFFSWRWGCFYQVKLLTSKTQKATESSFKYKKIANCQGIKIIFIVF